MFSQTTPEIQKEIELILNSSFNEKLKFCTSMKMTDHHLSSKLSCPGKYENGDHYYNTISYPTYIHEI